MSIFIHVQFTHWINTLLRWFGEKKGLVVGNNAHQNQKTMSTTTTHTRKNRTEKNNIYWKLNSTSLTIVSVVDIACVRFTSFTFFSFSVYVSMKFSILWMQITLGSVRLKCYCPTEWKLVDNTMMDEMENIRFCRSSMLVFANATINC